MLTDFQQSKFARRFQQLDADGDGFIQEQDLRTLADRLCDRLIPPGHKGQRADVHAGYQALWRNLTEADANGDGQISRDEFAAALSNGVLANPRHWESVERIVMAVFHALDLNGDGHLDLAELTKMGDAYGLTTGEVADLFAKIDTDGNEEISPEEFKATVRDFWYGDDPDSPGSFLFGRVG